MEEIQKNIVEWIQYDSKIKEESKKIKIYRKNTFVVLNYPKKNEMSYFKKL